MPATAADVALCDERRAVAIAARRMLRFHRARTVSERSAGASLVRETDPLVHERLAVLEQSPMSRIRVETQLRGMRGHSFSSERNQLRYVGFVTVIFILDKYIHNVYRCGDGTPEGI